MRGLQQIFGLIQKRFGTFFRQKLKKTLGADPCPASEQSLKMIFAQPDVRGHLIQLWLIFIMIFKVQDRLLDAQVILS